MKDMLRYPNEWNDPIGESALENIIQIKSINPNYHYLCPFPNSVKRGGGGGNTWIVACIITLIALIALIAINIYFIHAFFSYVSLDCLTGRR